MAVSSIPQNIRRIRTSCGSSQGKVALDAGLSLTGFRNIETGQAEPRVSTLQAIARALGVGLSALLAEPPRLSSVRFRSSKTKGGKARAIRDQVVIDVARWLKDFTTLEESLNQRKPYALKKLADQLSGPSGPNQPIEAARLVREALGLTSNEPVYDIYGLLESAGVKVRTLELNAEDLFGLSVALCDGGPAVVVNVREDISVERRIFTAAHELGHLLLHPNAYDVGKIEEDANEEKEADLFASYFLMPDKVFRNEWSNTYGLPFVDRVLHVKRIFRVSYQTVLFRLVELGLADSSKVWMVFKAQYRQRYGVSLTQKIEPVPLEKIDFVEDRLRRLVREALESEKITLSRGAEILGFDLNTMRDMVASWEIAA